MANFRVKIRAAPVQELKGNVPVQVVQPGIVTGEGQGIFFVIARGNLQSGRGGCNACHADPAAQLQDLRTGGSGVLEQVPAKTDRRRPYFRPVGQAFVFIVYFQGPIRL